MSLHLQICTIKLKGSQSYIASAKLENLLLKASNHASKRNRYFTSLALRQKEF